MITHSFLLSVDGVQPADLGLEAPAGSRPVEVVGQFDLRGLSAGEVAHLYDARAFWRRYDSVPTAGEIGCALAHRYCYERFLSDGGEVALITEDDARWGPGADAFLGQVLAEMPAWDVISLNLTYGMFEQAPVALGHGVQAHRATTSCFGSSAYLITRAAASHFLRRQSPRIRHLADWPDETWKLRFWGLTGGPVSLRDRPSTIGRSAHRPTARAPRTDALVYAGRSLSYRLRRAWRLRVRRDRSF